MSGLVRHCAQDAPLLAAHLEGLAREGAHVSRVYRLVLPPPHYTVHVITKSRVFRPNPSLDFKGERGGEQCSNVRILLRIRRGQLNK